MPLVEVTLVEGRSLVAVQKMAERITDVIVETIHAPRETVRVILREVPAGHWIVGGVPKEPAET